MGMIDDAVREYLIKENLNFSEDTGLGVFRLNFGLQNCSLAATIVCQLDEAGFNYTLRTSVKVVEDRRDAVMKFVTMANFGMRLGGFQLDLSDGEILFYASSLVGSEPPEDAVIERIIWSSNFTVDRYFNGLMKVIYADADPVKTVRHIEQKNTSSLFDDIDFDLDHLLTAGENETEL